VVWVVCGVLCDAWRVPLIVACCVMCVVRLDWLELINNGSRRTEPAERTGCTRLVLTVVVVAVAAVALVAAVGVVVVAAAAAAAAAVVVVVGVVVVVAVAVAVAVVVVVVVVFVVAVIVLEPSRSGSSFIPRLGCVLEWLLGSRPRGD